MIVSFFLASYYYGNLSRLILRYLPDQNFLISLFSFLFLFGLSVFLFHGFGVLMKKVFQFSLLGWLDRGLGVLFGLIKGVVIVFFLATVLTLVLPKTSTLLNQSRLLPWVISLTDHLTLLIPGKIREDFNTKKRDFFDYWEGKPAPKKSRP